MQNMKVASISHIFHWLLRLCYMGTEPERTIARNVAECLVDWCHITLAIGNLKYDTNVLEIWDTSTDTTQTHKSQLLKCLVKPNLKGRRIGTQPFSRRNGCNGQLKFIQKNRQTQILVVSTRFVPKLNQNVSRHRARW